MQNMLKIGFLILAYSVGSIPWGYILVKVFKGKYIREIERQRNVKRSYTYAVVTDSKEKAEKYLGEDEFDKAKQLLARAFSVINENKLVLGDELYGEYNSRLTVLGDQITNRREEFETAIQARRRQQAKEMREQIRMTMEEQRAQQEAEREPEDLCDTCSEQDTGYDRAIKVVESYVDHLGKSGLADAQADIRHAIEELRKER